MSGDVESDGEGRDRWAEALTWYRRLRSPQTERLSFARRRQWQIWYADAENRRIFTQASRLLEDRSRYAERRRPTRDALARDRYDLSVPIAQWQPMRYWRGAAVRRSPTQRWRWLLPLAITVAAASVPCVLWLGGYRTSAAPAKGALYRTQVGGLEDVRLSDGSRMILGGRTEVTVTFSARRRQVRLIQGQAWFKVADEPHWPFAVTAGTGRITDLGTAFLVTRESDRVVVTVTQGAVEVADRASTIPPADAVGRNESRSMHSPIRVDRGEELVVADDGVPNPVRQADVRSATAWIHGRLTFDDQPLRYVVETVNRYSSRRISVDRAAGELRYSGIVRDDRIEEWLQSLQVILPVDLRPVGREVRIQLRRPAATTPISP